jgi:hypothetical protein
MPSGYAPGAPTKVDARSTIGRRARRGGSRIVSRMRSRIAPVLTLALLAPFIGEFLLGNLTVRELPALLFLMPLYGGGAVLIREAARRTGRGVATMLGLGLAYGLAEPGLFDGSLFSASYEGVDYTGAWVPALGLSAFYAVQFAVNHAVWSITIPIVLAESLYPARRTEPWLGRAGFAVGAVVYLLGGLLIRHDSVRGGKYHVAWWQALGVVVVAAGLAVVALRLPRPAPRGPAGWAPRPGLAGVAAFVASTVYFALPETWVGVALCGAFIAGTAAAIRWIRWRPEHRIALVTGALLTYAWAGFLLTALKHHDDPAAYLGNAVFTGLALVFCGLAQRRSSGGPHLGAVPGRIPD